MITTTAIYIISMLVGAVALILPDFQLWPDKVLNSVNYIVGNVADLNSIFFYFDNILEGFAFFLKFLAYFMIYILAVKIINLLRGAEGL